VATVEAGVTLQQLQEAADEQGLAFPLDLGARGSATLGGNASTNAGGNRVLRFGMMREMVLGLEAVLADGTVIRAMNRLIKNNSGFDLKQLFIGAEGTLGVITRLVLRLREKPARQDVAFAAVPGFDALAALLKHMDRALGGGLSAFEVMWPEFYELVTTPPAKGRAPIAHGSPFYVLIESMGGDSAGGGALFQSAFETAVEDGLVTDAVVAKSQAEVAGIWALRDDVLQAARWGLPFVFDVSLPVADMPAYVAQVQAGLRASWPGVRCYVFGHMGDGNLHVVISPEGLPSDRARRGRAHQCAAGAGGRGDFGRARYRAGEEGLAADFAQPGGDRLDAYAQTHDGSQGNPEPRARVLRTEGFVAGTVLVSGGSGYIAGFLIRQLVADGWMVHTTVRDLAREGSVRKLLAVRRGCGSLPPISPQTRAGPMRWPGAAMSPTWPPRFRCALSRTRMSSSFPRAMARCARCAPRRLRESGASS
jgi:hypothetical protein